MNKSTKNLLLLGISIFIISGIITLLGALFKLEHWPMAGTLLTLGIVTQAVAYLIGGIALIQYIRTK